jgi:hypothetical protein
MANLQLAHLECNQRKGGRPLASDVPPTRYSAPELGREVS